jgi:hypothetical protein
MPFGLTGGAIPAPPEWFSRRSWRFQIFQRFRRPGTRSPVASDTAAAEYDYEGEK